MTRLIEAWMKMCGAQLARRIALFVGVGVSLFAQSSLAVEQALLSGDWPQVVQELEQVANPRVARFLSGHAALAQNQNNEATLAFLRATDEDVADWLRWTKELHATHPANSFALYLYGDALARIGETELALAELTQANSAKPNALVLNAIAQLLIASGDFDSAIINALQSLQINPGLADAAATLGALGVFMKIAVRDDSISMKAYNRAIAINNRFALAYNGRGILRFIGGSRDTAVDDLYRSEKLLPELGVSSINIGMLLTHDAGQRSEADRRVGNAAVASNTVGIGSKSNDTGTFESEVSALPYMTAPQQKQVISKYGWPVVKSSLLATIEGRKHEIIQLNNQVADLNDQVRITGSLGTAVAWAKGALMAFDAGKNTKRVKSEGLKPLASDATKSVISNRSSRTVSTIVDSISPNPYQSTLNSSLNIASSIIDDRFDAAQASQAMRAKRAGQIGLEVRNLYRVIEAQSPPDPRIQISQTGRKVGGVGTGNLEYVQVDYGNWPSLIVLGLCYN